MDDNMINKLVEEAQRLAEPLDLQSLIDQGLILKKGKCYYLNCDPAELPKLARRRIVGIEKNKNGVKVNFSRIQKQL
ncbi:hypothetical protein [Simiduia agarivorans]|uniref:Uncharacterized protein n=1 Tax=Simiduia agarivorans (strain DSM 21679 / JCM 13881 / BCRC 17597 / SA1) TaxID=1117647 RepID=K4KFG3_SIMAS|nr:hypothetical protein [Simiduia agarivorans]AFU97814.1 hypothetical protein M5M_03015 [Simiduia agarivorans SA1 = DSM 21679]